MGAKFRQPPYSVAEANIISKSITANGTYNASSDSADGYNPVTVNVPESVIVSKSITANGTYNASSDNANGYNPVTVNVPESVIVSKSITANGTYNASSDNANGYNPVTVNVPQNYAIHFDFKNSLIDTVEGISATLSNATRDSSGVHLNYIDSNVSISKNLARYSTFYIIKFGTISFQDLTRHNRIFVYDSNNPYNSGLIYRSTGYWGVYDYINGWQMTAISDPDYFSNSEVTIHQDISGHWHIYRNGVLIFEPANALNMYNTPIYLGAGDNSGNITTVESLSIY